MPFVAFLVAIAGGFLLNLPWPPDVMVPNEIAAVLGWGLVLALLPVGGPARPAVRATWPLLGALGLVALGCAGSMAIGGLPVSPGLATLGVLALAALLVVHGASAGVLASGAGFRPFAIALVATGVCSAVIAVLQIFAPESLDNALAARLVYPGRAVGNLGQPNHLADSLVWALAALVPLAQSLEGAGRRAAKLLAAGVGVLLLLGVILTGSRTGLVGIALLPLWGLLDRRLPKALRRALLLAPVVAAALWWGVDLWTQHHQVVADLGARKGSDLLSSRDKIWRDALTLIAQQPWLGVGWGQYSFAWALTPGLTRLGNAPDNAHDLPLHLAVELGVPGALVIVGLLVAAGVAAFRRAAAREGQDGTPARAVLVILAMVMIHSLLEYPLWYTFFLLPTAWLWGGVLGAQASRASTGTPAPASAARSLPHPSQRTWRIVGLLFVASAASAWLAYRNIVSLYLPAPDAAPLPQRIRMAQAGVLFSVRADYVFATEATTPGLVLPEIQRAARANTDGLLLHAWANGLEAAGQDDRARYVAARLREWKLSGAVPYFAPCDDPAVSPKPFQCLPPAQAYTWRDFR